MDDAGRDFFTDAYGNDYYRLHRKETEGHGLDQYRILYKATHHTFVGYVSDRLHPLQGTYYIQDRQIKGLWLVPEESNAATIEPICDPNGIYKMIFHMQGEKVLYLGSINTSMRMHGEGELSFMAKQECYQGTWWDDTPAQKQFKIYNASARLLYEGYIDECYRYHGPGALHDEAGWVVCLDTTFYHGAPLQDREARLIYANGDVYHGVIAEDGLPDGLGKLDSKKTGRVYNGRWQNGRNVVIKYRVDKNVIFRGKLDALNREKDDGSYQLTSSGVSFPNKSVPQQDALLMLADVTLQSAV